MAAYTLSHARATNLSGNTATYTPTGSLASTMFSTSVIVGRGLSAWDRSFLEGKQLIQKCLLNGFSGVAKILDGPGKPGSLPALNKPGYSAQRTLSKLLDARHFSPNRVAKAEDLLRRIIKMLDLSMLRRMTRRQTSQRRHMLRAVWKVR